MKRRETGKISTHNRVQPACLDTKDAMGHRAGFLWVLRGMWRDQEYVGRTMFDEDKTRSAFRNGVVLSVDARRAGLIAVIFVIVIIMASFRWKPISRSRCRIYPPLLPEVRGEITCYGVLNAVRERKKFLDGR